MDFENDNQRSEYLLTSIFPEIGAWEKHPVSFR